MEGTELSESTVVERGLINDRRYMLIDHQNNFISQRSHSLIALMKPKIYRGMMTISYKDEQVDLDLNTVSDDVISVTLFDNIVEATTVSKKIDNWFSDVLKENVRLVKMTESNVRTKALIKGPQSTEVSFADGYPILIVGTSSLENLNSKLEEPVLMNRFRPNIVIDTDVPHIEDSWEQIKIGSSNLMVIKPCARCPVVTIEQETATRSKEPLRTLATYRKINNKVYFGANAICMEEGVIGIGDEVISL